MFALDHFQWNCNRSTLNSQVRNWITVCTLSRDNRSVLNTQNPHLHSLAVIIKHRFCIVAIQPFDCNISERSFIFSFDQKSFVEHRNIIRSKLMQYFPLTLFTRCEVIQNILWKDKSSHIIRNPTRWDQEWPRPPRRGTCLSVPARSINTWARPPRSPACLSACLSGRSLAPPALMSLICRDACTPVSHTRGDS